MDSSFNSSKGQTIIDKSDKKAQNSNVEIVTAYKTSNVIIGAKLYMSADDARAIMHLTQPTEHDGNMSLHDYALLLLDQHKKASKLLRAMATAVLCTPADPSITMENITSKY